MSVHRPRGSDKPSGRAAPRDRDGLAAAGSGARFGVDSPRVVSRSGAQVPAAAVRRAGRPGARRAHADQRHRPEPGAPRVPVHRRARRRQDQRGAHPGQGALLREGADRHAVRQVRLLPGDRERPARSTSSRSTAPRTPASTTSAPARGRALPARARGKRKVYIIDEVHMLSPERVQRAASRRWRSRPRTWCSSSRPPRCTRSRSRSCRAASATTSS